jgi:phosphoribulokinase
MSIRHPIIAITGSSGAGTTSVTRTFENIFRRENIKAAVIEGDSFHRYDRKAMKLKAAEAEAAATRTSATLARTTTCFPSWRAVSRIRETGTGKRRKYLHDCRGGRALQTGPRHLHPVGRRARRHRLLFYEGLHGAVVTPEQTLPSTRPADRRGAGHQPGVDPEAVSRQKAAWLQHRGGHRHHPAPHA